MRQALKQEYGMNMKDRELVIIVAKDYLTDRERSALLDQLKLINEQTNKMILVLDGDFEVYGMDDVRELITVTESGDIVLKKVEK